MLTTFAERVQDFESAAPPSLEQAQTIHGLMLQICRHPWDTPQERHQAQNLVLRLELLLHELRP